MKLTKKLLAIMLSLIMVFTMIAVPVSAAGTIAEDTAVEEVVGEETTDEEAAEEESVGQFHEIFEAIRNLIEAIHNLVGGIMGNLGKECPFCDEVHEKDVEEPEEDGDYTVTFDLNYDGAPEVNEQIVVSGNTINMPSDPEREGYIFIGWYTDKECVSRYNFSYAIIDDITLFAGWFDADNSNDTDNDGLIDALEIYFETEITKADTDGDTLTDYEELYITYTNPLFVDSNDNGIEDLDEDFDGDQMNNGQECSFSTNPYSSDTDNDTLSDYEEIYVYFTNPINADSDNDGLEDGIEVEYLMDPNDSDTLDDGILDGNRIFNVSTTSEDYSVTDTVKPSLFIAAKGNQISSIDVNKVDNDVFLTDDIPGYIGNAYDFVINGDFDEATISFEIPEELFEDPEFIPAIYYFNEDSQCFEELADQTLVGNVISAKTTHFSKYIVLAKNVYEKTLFEFEILAPTDEEMQKTKFDLALVLDESGSVASSDYRKMKDIAKNFVSKLAEEDRVAVFTFSDYVTKDSTFVDAATATNVISSLGQDNGLTAIYDGINAANNEFIAKSSDDATKIMIVLTDGQDNSSRYSYSSVTNTAASYQIVIYTIGIGSVNTSVLTKIAQATGGTYYSASNYSQLGEIFERIDVDKDLYKDSDSDGISDYHEKKIAAGEIKVGTGAMITGFETLNYLSNDSDNDGVLDGEEIKILSQTVSDKEVYYCKMYSNPCMKDSDFDGLNDCVDTAPLELGLKNGIIGAVKLFSNTNTKDDAGHSFITFTSYVNNTVSFHAFDYQADNYFVAPNSLLSFGLTQSDGASSSDGENGNNRGFSVNAEIRNGGTSYYTGTVSVSREVTMDQLNSIIDCFEANNYYHLVNHNCATIATRAWNITFGENFNCKNIAGLDTPAALKRSIEKRSNHIVNDAFEKTIKTSCDICN